VASAVEGVIEFAILALFWAGFLGVLAVTPEQRMQMTWLLLVALVFISPVAAWFWPQIR
jgi:hypothetical protein